MEEVRLVQNKCARLRVHHPSDSERGTESGANSATRQAGGHWFEPSTAHSVAKSGSAARSHDDFATLAFRSEAWVADAGSAGIGGGDSLLLRRRKHEQMRLPERGRGFLDMRLDIANDPTCRGGCR